MPGSELSATEGVKIDDPCAYSCICRVIRTTFLRTSYWPVTGRCRTGALCQLRLVTGSSNNKPNKSALNKQGLFFPLIYQEARSQILTVLAHRLYDVWADTSAITKPLPHALKVAATLPAITSPSRQEEGNAKRAVGIFSSRKHKLPHVTFSRPNSLYVSLAKT